MHITELMFNLPNLLVVSSTYSSHLSDSVCGRLSVRPTLRQCIRIWPKVGRYLTQEIAEKMSCCLIRIKLGIRVPQSVLFLFSNLSDVDLTFMTSRTSLWVPPIFRLACSLRPLIYYDKNPKKLKIYQNDPEAVTISFISLRMSKIERKVLIMFFL